MDYKIPDKKTLLSIVAVIIIISAVVSVSVFVYRKQNSENYTDRYSQMDDDWTDTSPLIGTEPASITLAAHHDKPEEMFLSELTSEYKFPMKTHAEQGKTSLEYVRENAIDNGERLKHANYMRIHGLN